MSKGQVVNLQQPRGVLGQVTLVFTRPPHLPASTSNELLLKAVKAAALGVKDGEVAQMLGVPVQALDYWTKTKEWKQLRATITEQVKEMVAMQVADMAAKALRELNDRLDHGNKTLRVEKRRNENSGETEYIDVLARVPLSAMELTNIANTLFDRADRLERANKGQDTPEMEAVKALADKLAYLDAREIKGEATQEPDALDAEPVSSVEVPE